MAWQPFFSIKIKEISLQIDSKYQEQKTITENTKSS